MSQLLSWILIKIDLLSWLCHVMICVRKINWTLNSELWLMISINAGECVENWTERVTWFLFVSYPPRIELWTLDKKKKLFNEGMWIRNAWKTVSYIVILTVFTIIFSCPVVSVLYNRVISGPIPFSLGVMMVGRLMHWIVSREVWVRNLSGSLCWVLR